jgi:hypothetical protein
MNIGDRIGRKKLMLIGAGVFGRARHGGVQARAEPLRRRDDTTSRDKGTDVQSKAASTTKV